jgi:hypothetical protein
VLQKHLGDDLMQFGVVYGLRRQEGSTLARGLIESVEEERFDLKPTGRRSHLSNTLAEVEDKR